jgi:hypothetical protein
MINLYYDIFGLTIKQNSNTVIITQNMKTPLLVKGNQIDNLITKFYFKNRQLHFQIILNLGSEGKLPYCEFEDYYEYKEKFNELLEIKESDKDISISAMPQAA